MINAAILEESPSAIYSAIDHFVRLHRARLVGMFETFCDEAGGADHGFIAVCGWLVSVDHWRKFESDWKALLERYGVPHLHMKDVVHFRGPYAKWNTARAEREEFLSQAAGIIRQTVELGPFDRGGRTCTDKG